MKPIFLAAILAFPGALSVSAPARANPPAGAETPYYSTSRSTLGELIDNPATKAIVSKYLPEVFNSSHVEQARGLTLKDMQPLAPALITDDKLNRIDDELRTVPAPRRT